jgi:hypothetical protein
MVAETSFFSRLAFGSTNEVHRLRERGEAERSVKMVAETSFFSRLAFGSTNEVHRLI